MKKRFFAMVCLGVLTGAVTLGAYDLNTPELVPVKMKTPGSHRPVKLIENGKLNFAIVSDTAAEARMAKKNRTKKSIGPAVEAITDAIEKCTGKKPVVADVKDAAKYPHLIVVGDNGIARENGVDVSKLPPQGFAVRSFDRGIIIAGNDSSLIEGCNMKPLEGRGSSLGTLYGAYDFNERFLGVRYYFPGEYGTLHPKTENLTVDPVHYEDAPYFDQRNGWFYCMNCTVNHPGGKKFWEPYLGKITKKDLKFPESWRMGGTIPGGGSHCPRPERIAKAYPDQLKTIFYTSPKRKFWYNPKAHIGNYYNVIDLKFADLLIGSYKKFYESGGKIDEGGYRSQGCNQTYISFGVCDTLMPDQEVMNDPTVRKLGLMTEKDLARGDNAGMANIYARFHRYLAKRIAEELPGKKLYIMAYYNAKYAGTDPRWRLPPNTEVNLCIGGLPAKTRNPKLMKAAVRLAKEWYESLGNRPVQKLWLYTGKNHFVNAVCGEFVGDIPKLMGKYLGRQELFYDHCISRPGENVWFHYTSSYCAYRSMWNPDWDAAKAIDLHWEPFYGKETGAALREFHQMLRDCYRKYALNSAEPGILYPMAEIRKMEALLAQAKKSVRPGSVEEKRLNVFLAPWGKAFASMKNQLSYERPVYQVHQLLNSEEVTLDGTGSETFWSKVKAMPLIDPKGTGIAPKYPASVKLAWNKSGIYGLLETSYAPAADKSRDIWSNDTWEMIFSPGMKRETEYQFVFDPLKNLFLGTKRHLPIPQPFDGNWKAPGFTVESKFDAKKWTAEFFIPFSVFPDTQGPRPYDIWLCNIVRNKMGDNREYSGSAMTLGRNHNLSMFGIIKFAGKGE